MKCVFCRRFAIFAPAFPAFAAVPAPITCKDNIPAISPNLRETLSRDQGWHFHLDEIPLTGFGDSGGLAFGPPAITDSDGKTGATWGAIFLVWNPEPMPKVARPR
jgi:hypothetical protein